MTALLFILATVAIYAAVAGLIIGANHVAHRDPYPTRLHLVRTETVSCSNF